MPALQLRPEFQSRHMKTTAIELSNRQNTGWTQRKSTSQLLEISYPTADVRRALDSVSMNAAGKPVVMIGQRGSGKSHIMALVHHAFGSPDEVESWAHSWGAKLGQAEPTQLKLQVEKLTQLKLQRGFMPISETLSSQEVPCLWDVLFERHPKGQYFRGRFENSGTLVPAKSLIQDMFAEQKTALILDELQTWYDGLHDEPGAEGKKRLKWAFNFIQTLSELAEERPDLFTLVASVRDNTTDAFKQIRRNHPVIIDFKGDTARDDRKRLVLHRLFQNRDNIAPEEIEAVVSPYANERVRLLYPQKTAEEQSRIKKEVADCWPYAPELLRLLEDHLLMAAAAQDNRDFIRMLAEVYRVRGHAVPLITPADFCVDDDDCGVTTLVDSFATSADQEGLRERAIRNLQSLQEAGVQAPHAREVISGIWVRSLSAAQDVGATRNEVQLDITRGSVVDDNAFTSELNEILSNSFNIHEVGSQDKRFCFKLPENPESKLKSWARNEKAFEPQAATAAGLIPVRRDQQYLKTVLNYVLKSPDGTSEPPSQPVILDPNWERSPWVNLPQGDQPSGWTEKGKPVLLVLPVSPKRLGDTLGPWLADHVPQNRNTVRFLLPAAESEDFYEDKSLLVTARCALLASEWKERDNQYDKLHRKYEHALKNELKSRFDRYALLSTWDFQNPKACTFHEERHGGTGSDIPAAVEKHIVSNHFAPEDFETFAVEAAQRGETMRQVLALLREPPLPGERAIPYLGDLAIYEQVIRCVAKGKIAINVSGHWHHKEPGENTEDAVRRLRQKAWCTGLAMFAVHLGELSSVGGSGGVVAPAPVVTPVAPTPVTPPIPSVPIPTTVADLVGGDTPQPPTSGPPLVPSPVIHQSIGPKSGVNLLGEIEKWALPDGQKVMRASLTLNGISVKEIRELCMKLPPKLQAELQLILPPEGGAS